MKLTVYVTGSDDQIQEELVIEVPSDMRAGSLVDALRRQGVLTGTEETKHKVIFEIPPDRLLTNIRLQDLDAVIIKQEFPSVQILERKPRGASHGEGD